MNRNLSLLFVLLCIGLLNASCSNVQISNMDKIHLKYQDSSVPPQYHRSYDIIADKTTTKVTVKSYDVVLADTTFNTSATAFKKIQENLKVGISTTGITYKPMSGSNITYISIENKNNTLLDEKWTKADKTADLSKLKNDIRALVPNLSDLCAREVPGMAD